MAVNQEWYNRGKYLLATGALDLSTADVRMALVTSSYTFNPDHNTMDEVSNEVTGTGYSRKTLATLTVTENDTDNCAYFGADNVSWTGASFSTPAAAVLYVEGIDDSARELIAYVRIPSAPAPIGSTYAIEWDGGVILQIG